LELDAKASADELLKSEACLIMVVLRSDRVDAVNDVKLMNEGGNLIGLKVARDKGEALTLWLRSWLGELVSDESASAEEYGDEAT